MSEKKPSWRAKTVRWVVALGVVAGVAFASVSSIAQGAASNEEETLSVEAGQRWAIRLEGLFRREKAILAREEKRLAQAAKIEDRLAARIQTLEENGRDTAELAGTLADLKAAASEARSYYEAAKAVIDTHAGFDDAGKVVDRTQAKETVKTAGTAERKFFQTMRKAVREVARAVLPKLGWAKAQRMAMSNLRTRLA